MDNENDSNSTLTGAEPVFMLNDLDEETIEILVDDKIATGG